MNLFFKLSAILIFYTNIDCFSQSSSFISGVVFDQDTDEPIAYANIGVKRKFMGTVTDSTGYFSIDLYQLSNTDTIEISRLGYGKFRISVKDLKEKGDKANVILLRQLALDMEEFLVAADPSGDTKIYGNSTLKSRFAYAFNPIKSRASGNLGREVAIEVNPGNKPVSITAVKFVLSNNQMDELILRVNLYNENSEFNGLPGERYFEKIFRVENKFMGEYVIELENYNLNISEKFWVSIEFLNYRNDNEFGIVTLPVKMPFGKMLVRNSSLGEWNKNLGSPSIQVEAKVFKEVLIK
ncbi:carboxypeptidase-like regulatory domain-containing protein [Anditalea andensis]|nr:carboxypeptidase-like regulatory domain-containing protein [Anditalea andensis]